VKTILITGGTAGIGQAIAQVLVSKNMHVIVTGRSLTTGNQPSTNITHLQLEITDNQSIAAAAEFIHTQFGKIDGVVNNAGIGIMAPVLETDLDIAKEVFDVNVWGPIELINAVFPYLNKGASIVNITSIAGNFGLPYRGFYSASKAAFDCLTESLKMELRNMDIHVFALQPGDIQTNIAGNRKMATLANDSQFKQEYEFSIQQANEHVAHGLPPEAIAHKVHELIERGGSKSIYRVAPFLQRITPLIKALLPQARLRKMILNHHQLK